jgi:hypothetical protein
LRHFCEGLKLHYPEQLDIIVTNILTQFDLLKVGRWSLTVSQPVLKAPMGSTLESTIR